MFNGGPIRNLIRIAVSEDTLTVQLLRSTDSGTYACIANNTHGTTYKTFQLDVAGESGEEGNELYYFAAKFLPLFRAF